MLGWLSVLAMSFQFGGIVYLVDAEDFESIGTETTVGMTIVGKAQVALHILPLRIFKGV